MASAEGQVQNLKYEAAFPLLLNISDQPTYFMALKDGAGLVKKYAMVNVQKYQTVAIGDSVSECEKNYEKLLSENGIASDGTSTGENNTVTGTIKRMAQAVIEGNSHFYITLEPETQKITGPDEGNIQNGQTLIFDASITSFPEIIGFDEGDTLTMEFKLGQPVCKVVTLEGQEAADAEESQQPEEEQPADTEE